MKKISLYNIGKAQMLVKNFLLFLLLVSSNIFPSTVTLYSSHRSSSSLRVALALAYKGISYQTQEVTKAFLESKEYREKNPQGKIPTLLIGEKVLTQSVAIIEFLEENFPQKPLLPEDPYLKAKVRCAVQLIVSDIQPLQNLSVLEELETEKRAAWAQHWILKGLQALESLVDKQSLYTVGNEVSIADLCLLPQLRNARLFNIDMHTVPTLLRIEKQLLKVPALYEVMQASIPVHR